MKSKQQTFKIGGRGRRLCQCGVYLPNGTKVCPKCGAKKPAIEKIPFRMELFTIWETLALLEETYGWDEVTVAIRHYPQFRVFKQTWEKSKGRNSVGK
jgi:hypothetical protein